MEFEIRHAFSDFSIIRSVRSSCNSSVITTSGYNNTSLITNLPSTLSKTPFDSHLKLTNSHFEFSAMAKKVVIKQLLTAAVNKCSGDQIFGNPPGNSGGVATSMQLVSLVSFFRNSGEQIMPFRSCVQLIFTL